MELQEAMNVIGRHLQDFADGQKRAPEVTFTCEWLDASTLEDGRTHHRFIPQIRLEARGVETIATY